MATELDAERIAMVRERLEHHCGSIMADVQVHIQQLHPDQLCVTVFFVGSSRSAEVAHSLHLVAFQTAHEYGFPDASVVVCR